MQKQYFYKDKSGNLHKFYFCIRGCPEPYKEEDIGKKDGITKVTDHIHVCQKCLKTFELNEFKRGEKKEKKKVNNEVKHTEKIIEEQEIKIDDEIEQIVEDVETTDDKVVTSKKN